MGDKFQELAVTDAVRRARQHYYGESPAHNVVPENDILTKGEIDFIQARDSFYMATVSEAGWPYLQHRGGPPGFLHVVGPSALAFADFKGNRQLLSTGNLEISDRVALFLMDYPQRTRLKILGNCMVKDARKHPDHIASLTTPDLRHKVERLFFIEVVAFDWNCSQYITPRFTAAEITEAVAPLKRRIAELEHQLGATGKTSATLLARSYHNTEPGESFSCSSSSSSSRQLGPGKEKGSRTLHRLPNEN